MTGLCGGHSMKMWEPVAEVVQSFPPTLRKRRQLIVSTEIVMGG